MRMVVIFLNNLKKVRIERGMTLRELAEKVQTSVPYLSQLENGQRRIETIRQNTKDRLCEALSCDFSDILDEGELFEYRNGKLICDEIYLCRERRKPPAIVRIKNAYYQYPEEFDNTVPLHEQLTQHSGLMINRIRLVLNVSENIEVRRFAYAYLGLTLRKPYKVKVGRAVKPEEWDEFNLSSMRCSEEIKFVVGREFGAEAEFIIKVRQIMVADEVAAALIKRGVYMDKVESNCYNIRTA